MWLVEGHFGLWQKGIYRVRASHELARVSVSYDEANLVSAAGLLPAATLAQKVGLAELVEARVRLSEHGANAGTKALSVIGSILVGGDSIDDIALLRAGAMPELFDQLRAPSTIGTWLRSFKWSNVRELDAVTRGLLARLWAAGAGRALGLSDAPHHSHFNGVSGLSTTRACNWRATRQSYCGSMRAWRCT